MIAPESFQTRTLQSLPQGQAVTHILAAAINAVAPDEAVRRFARRAEGQFLIRSSDQTSPQERGYNLDDFRQVRILALGKAALPMSLAACGLLADRSPRGLLVLKHPALDLPIGFEQVVGGHPVPDNGSLAAAEKVAAFLVDAGSDDLLICLISGGGSALLSSPLPGLSLQDLQTLTSTLLACGARIDEINTLRRHLDRLKGGGLARIAAPAQVISLILSDVVGSPLEAIASGPTAPDPSYLQDAFGILEKYKLADAVPSSILEALRAAPETPKPGDRFFDRIQNVVVGDNLLAAQAGLEQARREGFNPFYLRGDLQGEARIAASELCKSLRMAIVQGRPVPAPFCIVAGGETTVTLRGNGRGGRNQELALAACLELADLPGCLLVSLATDGEDGPTDAAGAVVGPDSLKLASNMGLNAINYLEKNDSYHFFSPLGDLLKPGPTGTNVNDLTFLFGF